MITADRIYAIGCGICRISSNNSLISSISLFKFLLAIFWILWTSSCNIPGYITTENYSVRLRGNPDLRSRSQIQIPVSITSISFDSKYKFLGTPSTLVASQFTMRFSVFTILSAFSGVALGHFRLLYPPPRGEFVSDKEPDFCGTFLPFFPHRILRIFGLGGYTNPTNNRTTFPLTGGFWKIQVLDTFLRSLEDYQLHARQATTERAGSSYPRDKTLLALTTFQSMEINRLFRNLQRSRVERHVFPSTSQDMGSTLKTGTMSPFKLSSEALMVSSIRYFSSSLHHTSCSIAPSAQI